jgi:hypothetical protein
MKNHFTEKFINEKNIEDIIYILERKISMMDMLLMMIRSNMVYIYGQTKNKEKK